MTKRIETNISFYLKANRIHLFIDSLRGIGCPKRICFLLDNSGNSLLMLPHGEKDLISHNVPNEAYNGLRVMEVSSKKLCQIIASLHGWDINCSYRIPGTVIVEQQLVKYDLSKAQQINNRSVKEHLT